MLRANPNHARTRLAVLAVAIMAMPGLSAAITAGPEPSEARNLLAAGTGTAEDDAGTVRDAIAAEEEFDGGAYSLLDLALLVAGVESDTDAADDLALQLETLDSLPPVYYDVARATLEGMAQARWHQERALQGLSESDRTVLAAARPEDPMTDELAQALAKVDMHELARGLDALLAASEATVSRIQKDHADASASDPGPLQSAFLDALGGTWEPVDPYPVGQATPDVLSNWIARAAGLEALTAAEREEIESAFADAPQVGVEAILQVLQALPALSHGARPGHEEALLRMAAAVDAAHPTLQIWSAMALAAQLAPPDMAPLPDPNAAVPPLDWGRPKLTSGGFAGPAPALATAVEDLARVLGDEYTAANADELAAPLDALEPEHRESIARVLDTMRLRILATREAAANPIPEDITMGQLVEWKTMLGNGTLLEVGSQEADMLMAAVPAMEAQRAAMAATEDLMHAVQDVVRGFSQPAAATYEDTPLCDVPAPPRITFILGVDLCGEDTHWDRDTMFLLDVGGDDVHTHRAGAPFLYDPNEDVPSVPSGNTIPVPINILVDLGGSDTYETTEDCAQGAACAALVPAVPVASGTFVDDTPTSILIDWAGDGADDVNSFSAGNRSQGYGAAGVALFSGNLLVRPYPAMGILIERTGLDGRLVSSYDAGAWSQGSTQGSGSLGCLIRLVGDGTSATGSFAGGDRSQGAGERVGILVNNGGQERFGAVFMNVAGAAESDDSYGAGTNSQGAGGLFADAVDAAGQSHDTYVSGASSKGFDGGVFLDAILPPAPAPAEDSLQVDGATMRIEPSMKIPPARSDDTYSGTGPDGYALSSGNFYDIGGRDTYELDDPEWGEPGAPQERPRNDGGWAPITNKGGNTGGAATFYTLYANAWDLGAHDDDRDAFPAYVEQLLNRRPDDGRYTPSPVSPRIILDLAGLDLRGINTSYAFVFDLGGRDVFGAGFSAGVHLDVAGKDRYPGRVAAATNRGYAREQGTLDDPPVVQQGLSFHYDGANDDEYVSPWHRNQGYAERGATGILLDLGGGDSYESMSRSQGVGVTDNIVFSRVIEKDQRNLIVEYEGLSAETPPLGGLGILADITTEGDSINTFRAGTESQGWADENSVGLLVATGGHNMFADGDEPLGHSGEGGGHSFNLGENPAPEILIDETWPQIFEQLPNGTWEAVPHGANLHVTKTYRFDALVRDPHGDDIRVCWTVEYGDESQVEWRNEETVCEDLRGDRTDGWRPTSHTFTWNETRRVITDATSSTMRTNVTYEVRLNAMDPGGAVAQPLVKPVNVTNQPPVLLPPFEVVGPTKVVQNQQAAYALPYLPEEDLGNVISVALWGDGRPAEGFFGNSINWAQDTWGGRTRLPEAAPIVAPLFGDSTGPIGNDLSHGFAIDGDLTTSTTFTFNPVSNPPIHLIVDFAQPRHIGLVDVNATVLIPMQFSVEGIGLDGNPVPIGTMRFDNGITLDAITLDALPKFRGIILRQVVDDRPEDPTQSFAATFILNEIRAMGPGIATTWTRAGDFTLNYTVVDDYGGRNSSTLPVHVEPDLSAFESDTDAPGGLPGLPVELVDVAGQGPVRHATTTFAPAIGDASQTHQAQGNQVHLDDPRLSWLTFRSNIDGPTENARLTVAWGDGQTTEAPLPGVGQTVDVTHLWEAPGTYEIHVTYTSDSVERGRHATTITVEEGFYLHYNRDPLMLLTLDQASAEAETTWHTGLQPLIIVDAMGDDRYTGAVAVPRAAQASTAAMPPSLVIDVLGDDDYLSQGPRTQGFGHLASMGLLVDVAGDDRYVAPSMAQGAAFKQGIGVLFDLGGNDRFNPLPPDHADIGEASPIEWEPWGDRPPSLTSARDSLVPSAATTVQGAAVEGVGLLVVAGGHDSFRAASQAQGWAAHDAQVQQFLQYAMPQPSCISGLNAAQPPAQGGPQQQHPTNPSPNDIQHVWINHPLLCALGITNAGGGARSTVLIPVTPSTTTNTNGLTQFLGPDAPRYGPAIGALIHLDGSASYLADSQAQGAAQVSARGILLDLDGAAVSSAGREAQGFTEDGQATFLAGGALSASLTDLGRGTYQPAASMPEGINNGYGPPVSNHYPLALFIAPGDDSPCSADGASCPGPAETPGPVTDAGDGDSVGVTWHLAQDVTPAIPGPVLEWTPQSDIQEGVLGSATGGSLRLGMSLGAATVPDPLGTAGPFEVRILAQPMAGAANNDCTGHAIAGAVTVAETTVPASSGGYVTIVDLDAMEEDGPVLPAGCHRVRAFVRQHLDATSSGAATEWSKLEGDIKILPPPTIKLVQSDSDDGVRIVTTVDQATSFEVWTPEPLALATLQDPDAFGLDLTFDLVTFAGELVQGDDWEITPVSGWEPPTDVSKAGAQRTFAINPPPAGDYILRANVGWAGSAHENLDLADFRVDAFPPMVQVDDLGGTWVKGSAPVEVRGTVEDPGTDVHSVQIRLLEDSARCAERPEAVLRADGCFGRFYVPAWVVDPVCLGMSPTAGDSALSRCALESVPTFPPYARPQHPCWPATCNTVEGVPIVGPGPASIGLPMTPGNYRTSEVVLATLEPIPGTPGRYNLAADLVTSDFTSGGQYIVQGRAVDFGGTSTGWIDLTHVGLDKSAPEVTAVESSVGTQATNDTNAPEPLSFRVRLQDCSISSSLRSGAACVGAGTDADEVIVLVRNTATGEMTPVSYSESTADGENLDAVFDWQGDTEFQEALPDPGRYEIIVQAQDRAGNLLSHNPGLEFFVDRAAPRIPVAGRAFILPDGQEWVKPGDMVQVAIDAVDRPEGQTWVDDVVAWVEGDPDNSTTLEATGQGHQFAGVVTMPDLPDSPDASVPLRIVVRAFDAARNPATIRSPPLEFYQRPSPIVAPHVTQRSDSLALDWSTVRPVQVQHAFLVAPDGDKDRPEDRIHGSITSDGISHSVSFTGLRDDTEYRLFLAFVDKAGHVQDFLSTHPIIQTLPLQDTDLFLDRPPGITYSRTIDITGRVEKAVQSRVGFYLQDPASAPFAPFLSVDGDGLTKTFERQLDSLALLPETREHAVVATVYAVMDDGATSWVRSVDVRFDNAAPDADPGPVDAQSVNGWYNGSILVAANAQDDTPPIDHTAIVNDGGAIGARSVVLQEDGRHVVRFELRDGASPPNEVAVERVFYVDKTAPVLEAAWEDADGITRDTSLGLAIQASDDQDVLHVSGLDAFRLRVDGGPWSSWQDQPPDQVTFADGEGQHWVEVEVRDKAHNVHRRSLPALVDKTAPDLLLATWSGSDQAGDPILHIAATDVIGGGGRSAGLDAVRLKVDGPEPFVTGWVEMNGTSAHAVPRALAQNNTSIEIWLKDKAGNLAQTNLTSTAPPAPTTLQVSERLPALDGLLSDTQFAPVEGNTQTRFAFVVVAAPRNGSLPDRVWAQSAGIEVELHASGPPHADGRQTYVGRSLLPPNRLGQAPVLTFHAAYGQQEVETPAEEGPTVFSVGIGGRDSGGGQPDAGIPATGTAWLVILIASLASLFHRRRKNP